MKTKISLFFRQNWIGTVSGIGYCGTSFLMFFIGLGYGASCPEAGPEVCDTYLEPIIPIFIAVSIIPISIWGIIFYSGQQLIILSGITTTLDYSSSFFAINILPGISFVTALFIWAMIGGFAQKFYSKIRK